MNLVTKCVGQTEREKDRFLMEKPGANVLQCVREIEIMCLCKTDC